MGGGGCGNTKKHITDELEYNKRARCAKERRMRASVISTRLGNKSGSPQQAAYLNCTVAGMLHLIVDSFELAMT